MHVERTILAVIIMAGVAPLAAPRAAHAASAKSQCIDDQCKPRNEQCKISFKAQFDIAKKGCKVDCSDKACKDSCKAAAKDAYQADKDLCKDAFNTCKTCCDAPSPSCTVVACGDGVKVDSEQCDYGAANSSTAPNTCRADCTLFRCGDGVVDYREACDGASAAACDGEPCDPDCTCAEDPCGNGAVDAGEECDGANDSACPGFCGPECLCLETLEFTTGTPGGMCGRINDAADGSGNDLDPFPKTCASSSADPGSDCANDDQCDDDAPCMGGETDCAGACGGEAANQNLECGTLYIGGGASVQPPSPIPDGATSIFALADTTTPTAVVLAATTSTEVGNNRNCTSPGCFFGPPLPIPNAGASPVSTCVYNQIAASPAVGGTLDITTGAATITLPLTVTVYVTGDIEPSVAGIQPCARCVNGLCATGANAGGTCTTPSSLLSSHDCPPPSDKTPLAPFGVDLSPLVTSFVSRSAADGNFCVPTPGQADPGAFGQPNAQYIAEQGMPSGSLEDGASHDAVQASVFCIPNSGDALVDAVANLPGTGAVTLKGTTRLAP